MNDRPHFGNVTLCVIDRNSFFRQGVRTALASHEDIQIVAESDVDQASYDLIEACNPQVALIDITPPAFLGIDLTRRVVQAMHGVSIVVLTQTLHDDELVLCTTAGASAYLSRFVDTNELAQTIRRVANGELLLIENLIAKPQILERVLRCFRDLSIKGRAVDSVNAPITERETEILSYVARGYGNKQIAHALGISEQTIKNHMTSILRKLDASDRTHAVVMAMQSGWITTSERYEPETTRYLD